MNQEGFDKRPDCTYCNTPESALTFFGGKLCCGECMNKLFQHHQEKSRKEMMDVIGSN